MRNCKVYSSLCSVQQVVGPALGAAAGPARWFDGVAIRPVCEDFQRRRQHSATTAHPVLPVCEWPALDISWGIERSMQALLGWWFVGLEVFLVSGGF